jgi:hypothetical protein
MHKQTQGESNAINRSVSRPCQMTLRSAMQCNTSTKHKAKTGYDNNNNNNHPLDAPVPKLARDVTGCNREMGWKKCISYFVLNKHLFKDYEFENWHYCRTHSPLMPRHLSSLGCPEFPIPKIASPSLSSFGRQ